MESWSCSIPLGFLVSIEFFLYILLMGARFRISWRVLLAAGYTSTTPSQFIFKTMFLLICFEMVINPKLEVLSFFEHHHCKAHYCKFWRLLMNSSNHYPSLIRTSLAFGVKSPHFVLFYRFFICASCLARSLACQLKFMLIP